MFVPESDDSGDCDLLCDDNLPLIHVPILSVSDVSESIRRLKGTMTSGPDGIPAFLIKDCCTVFAPVLLKLFSLVFRTLTFPAMWKKARVCPVWKNGDRLHIRNYRPISLISNFAKIFEISVYSRVFPCIRNSIVPEQHGFFANRSTSTNLVYFTQYLSNVLDCRGQVDVVYTDFSKAFDRIDHNVLFAKLRLFNFSRDFISLIRSYLSDRAYFVEYSGFSSETYMGSSGVPQGSNLGPLIFLSFINDLPGTLECSSLLYADDLKLFSRIDSTHDALFLQNQLDHLLLWCDQNKLQLNVAKCKIMSFTRKKEPTLHRYMLGLSALERVEVFRDLGVYFDSQLSFSSHVNETVKAAYKMLGFIIRNSDEFIGLHAVKSLYYAYVRSKLEYCAIVWSPFYAIHKLAIERVQRKFLKYLYFRKHRSYPCRGYPGDLLTQEFCVMSLEKRRILSTLVFLVNLVRRHIDCPAMLNFINFRIPRSGSRHDDVFLCPQPHTNIMLKSPVFMMIKFFNRICSQFNIYESSLGDLRRLVEVYF